MARHARILGLLFSSWALLTAAHARAQAAPSFDLHWRAPANCPQQPGVRERIEKLAGSKKLNDATLEADGAISEGDDGRYHLKLVVRSGGLVGERNIESKSCEQLAGAAAGALGLLLQSGKSLSSETFNDLTSNAGANGATSGAGARDSANQADGNRSASAAGTESRRRVRARLQVPMVALGVGPLSLPSFGFGLGAGVSVDEWIFFLQFTKWSQRHLSVPAFPAYGADVDRATLNFGGCRAFRRDAFEVAPCLTMSVEHLSATGMGDRVVPRTDSATWLAAGLGGQARVYFADWFALGATVMGQVETSRPQISIAGTGVGMGAGVGEVGRVGPAALTVLLGSEWIL